MKIISFGHALMASAMILREFSRYFFASRPAACTEDGFSGSGNNSCMRAATSGRIGAVAL